MDCNMEKSKVLWNLSAKEFQELKQLCRAWVDTGALPVKLAHIEKLLMDAQQIPVQERPIYLITAIRPHFLELLQNYPEGQGFVDATKADPGDDQRYHRLVVDELHYVKTRTSDRSHMDVELVSCNNSTSVITSICLPIPFLIPASRQRVPG
jgi:hypothetical protein